MINRVEEMLAPGNGRRRPPAALAPPATWRGASSRAGLARRLENSIGEHPVLSLSLGLTLGIVIGCLIKRR